MQRYEWIETTTTIVKGETKKTEQNLCQYAPDGTVQKSPIGSGPEKQKAPSGLKGKIAAKKVAEMKDYMTRLKSLIGEDVPPNRDRIQNAVQAGAAHLDASPGGTTSLTFNNYLKQGDRVTFVLDTAAEKIQTFSVDTYLDHPKNDVVILEADFASLPDGTNYVAQTDLQAKSKSTEIKPVNAQYQELHP